MSCTCTTCTYVYALPAALVGCAPWLFVLQLEHTHFLLHCPSNSMLHERCAEGEHEQPRGQGMPCGVLCASNCSRVPRSSRLIAVFHPWRAFTQHWLELVACMCECFLCCASRALYLRAERLLPTAPILRLADGSPWPPVRNCASCGKNEVALMRHIRAFRFYLHSRP